MANWILKGLLTGVLTTKYPKKRESDLESIGLVPAVVCKEGCISNCNSCKEVCYPGAIFRVDNDAPPVIDYRKCLFCSRCIEACPENVLSLINNNSLMEVNSKRLINITAKARIHFRHSLHIRHVDAGSCEACLSEINALNNPYYDISRLGCFFTSSPRHADVLMVSGVVAMNMEEALVKTYNAIPDPKLVIAVGACALSSCVIGKNYACRKLLESLIPVDVYIPGCPPSPLDLINGLLTAVGRRPDFDQHICKREVL